jgi:hypothetical protein
MMSKSTFAATSLAAVLLFSSSNAQAVGITIVNPGFETEIRSEILVPNTLGASGATGWDFYRPGSFDVGQYFGVYAPDDTNYNQTSAPEGSNIAYFDLLSGGGSSCSTCEAGDGTYPVGLQQTLTDTLQQNSRYDLSVMIGNPKAANNYNYDGFGGYRIELLAGSTVIGSDNNSLSIAEGDFAKASFSVFSDSVDVGLLGMALGIRLIHKAADEKPSGISEPPLWLSGVGFDDVQLSVSAVPVPAAVWLFGSALLGLIGFSKRRKIV